MTRRERLEMKLEKRRQWAESRRADSVSRFAAARQAIEHIPPGQPILVGHHSEKRHRAALARSDANMSKSCESSAMAKHHEEKADGIERQLDTSIFSDDSDAVEMLEARVAEREKKREWMKRINAAHKRFLKKPETLDASDLTEEEKKFVRDYKPAYSWEPHPFPPYSFQNLGASIRRDQERIATIKQRAARSEKAEQAGGVIVEQCSSEWCRVTFAEKPDRKILDSLKAAGFRWGSGSWSGRIADLPDCVKDS